MIKLVNNKYHLQEEDMTEVVRRVKVLLLNSNQEILLGYCHNEYQFIGGHVEKDESLTEAVIREVKEETGIQLKRDYKPFAVSLGYWKDWPEIGRNRKTEIYYYEVTTDDKPNMSNTSFTEHEKEGDYSLRYIPLENVIDVLEENTKLYEDRHGITKEMINLFQLYFDKEKKHDLEKENE